MAQEKWHLTTEQLSTFLDREVSAEERAQWEAHLSTCPQCQQELVGLRQTAALLHALPQPTLPRSFVLPLEAARPVAIPQAVAPTPIRLARRRTLNPYVRGVLRTMSALAAVIGVVFFLSGILPSLAMHNVSFSSNSSTTSNGSSVESPAPALSNHSVQSSSNGTKLPAAPRLATSTSTATPAATQAVKPQLPGDQKSLAPIYPAAPSSGPTFLIFNLSVPAGRIGLGMMLVILGIMGFVLFRRSRRRMSL